MPAGDIHGLSSGASVTPCRALHSAPSTGEVAKPVARAGVLRLPDGRWVVGRVVDAQGFRWIMGARAGCGGGTHGSSSDQCHGSGSCTGAFGYRRSCDQRVVDGRAWSASGPVRGLWGWQERIAWNDGPLHPCGCDRGGTHWRAGREVKEFVEDILGEDGRARSVVVAAPLMRRLCCACRAAYATAVARAFQGQRQACAAADGFADPLRHGAARNCAGHWRAASHQRLSPSCFAKLPQLVERSGNGLHGVGINYSVLYRAV